MTMLDDKCVLCGAECPMLLAEYYKSEYKWIFVCNDCIKQLENKRKRENGVR